MPIRNTRKDAGPRERPTRVSGEATIEEMLALVARMTAHVPHVPCPEDSGPLAPVAVALNQLSLQLSTSPPPETGPFSPQTLLAQAQSFMVACDTDARIRYANGLHSNLTAERVIGTIIYEWLTPESIDKTRVQIQKALSTGESTTFEGQTTSEGGSRWYMGLATPIKVDGRILGFTLIVNDITELKRTQTRLERSNQELENFAYVASHDLQEPLRKIQTFGDRLKSTCSSALPPEGLDYIERMQKAAARMRGLIDDLLTFSRVSSKPRPFVSVDLATLTREVISDLDTLVEKAGASISVGELPVLEADPMQMRQLLQNLLGNALKFRREGVPPALSVRATVDAPTQRCELCVEDNGIGFEEKYLDRIFNVFQRLHGRGQYEGSGIGLAICRKIAERHGGSITARSTPGSGSAFLVTLPLKQPSHAQ